MSPIFLRSTRLLQLTAFLVGLLGLIVLSAPALRADEPTKRTERWFVVLIQNQHAGWEHEIIERDGDHLITTRDSLITIRRAQQALQIKTFNRFTETVDGRPIEAVSKKTLGAEEITRVMRFKPDGVELAVTQAGQTKTQMLPRSEQSWTPPAARQREIKNQLKQGAAVIRTTSIDPSLGVDPVETVMTVKDRQPMELMGEMINIHVVETRFSEPKGLVQTECLDEHGRMVKTSVSLGDLTMTFMQADRRSALRAVDPPELISAMVVKPDQPIDRPRFLRQAAYQLRLKDKADADARLSAPNAGNQQATRIDDRTMTLHIDLDQPIDAGDDQPGEAESAATTMLNHRDPKIIALTEQALENSGSKTPLARAETLRRFVHRYINRKGLDVGFAGAAEVAVSRSGDCTEHGVLLAAMLRAEGVPSRVVTGLIYVDRFSSQREVFGYHMWTQAWIADADGQGGRWVDFDATQPIRFDAAHIALATSSLSDHEDLGDMAALAPLFGQLEITVLPRPRK